MGKLYFQVYVVLLALLYAQSFAQEDIFTYARAGNLEALQNLIEQGVGMDVKDTMGRTALMHAIVNNNSDVIKLLLEKGADVNTKDSEGRSALFYAYDPEIIEVLHNYGANLELANKKGFTPLHSVFWGCFGSAREDEEWFAWESPVDKDKCVETAITLLDLGANPNAKDKNGMTPFMHLMGISFSYDDNNKEIIYQHFINSGTNLELRDNKGLTASLHAAKMNNWGTWSEELLATGIDINTQDFEGNNALMLSNLINRYTRSSLWKAGILLNACNNKGETALILLGKLMAKEREQGTVLDSDYELALNSLLRMGADPTIKDNNGKTVVDYLAKVEELHDTDIYKNWLTQWDIFTYARAGNLEVLKSLIEQGADVNAQRHIDPATYSNLLGGIDNHTVLMASVEANQYQAAAMLLAAGADVNAEIGVPFWLCPHKLMSGRGGLTALVIAVEQDNLEMVKLLIGAGADINIKNCGSPVISDATSDGVVQLLLTAGAFLDYETISTHGATACIVDRFGMVNESILALIPENYTDISKNIGFGDLDRALRIMIMIGSFKLVKLLLEAGANPKSSYDLLRIRCASTYYHKTALELALEEETDKIARLLVEFGAAEELTDGELISKVAVAGFDGWLTELLAAKPDLSIGMAEGLGCSTLERMELLLAAGASLNEDSKSYDPPIALILSNCSWQQKIKPGFTYSSYVKEIELDKKQKPERLERLLLAGANPNVKNADGETALMLIARGSSRKRFTGSPACKFSYYAEAETPHCFESFSRDSNDLVLTLLEYGANPNIRDSQGRTALMPPYPFDASPTKADYISTANHNALRTPSFSNSIQIEVIKLLLDNGAELIADHNGITPLMDAFTNPEKENAVEIAQLYLQHGANIEAKDNWGRTPLMYALANNNLEGVKLLLENNTNVAEKDNEGRTALFYTYSPEAIELLHSHGANLDVTNNKGLTPTHSVLWGCFGSKPEKEWFAWLPESRIPSSQCLSALEKLLDLGANPNPQDENGMTPLMYAVKLGLDSFTNDFIADSYGALISAGADWELRDNEGKTILLQAATVSTKDSNWGAKYLVAGTNYATTDKESNNGLMLTIEHGGLQDFHRFLDKVPLDARNIHGETALILLGKLALKEKEEGSLTAEKVQLYSDSFTKLIQLGADPTLEDNKGKTVIDYLTQVEEFHSTEDGLVYWNIFTYASTGNLEALQNLIEQGANVNAYSRIGLELGPDGKITVLMAAVKAKQYKAVEMLLAAGAYVNATQRVWCGTKTIIPHDMIKANNYGETALSWAVEQDDLEIIKLLIDAGADVNVIGRCGFPAIHSATSDSVVQLLLEAGAFLDYEIIFSHGATLCSVDSRGMVHENLLALIPENYTDISKNIGFGDLDRALRIMITVGNYKLVKMLLEAGANPKTSYVIEHIPCGNIYKLKTALDLALEKENNEIARLLVEFGGEDREVISKVAVAGADDWLAELLAKNPDLSTGMAEGLGCTTLERMELLLAAGAHLNKDSESYDPPIALVLSNCNEEQKPERLEKLLAAGADPNTLNEDGETALMLAARAGIRKRFKEHICKLPYYDTEAEIPYCFGHFFGSNDLVLTLLEYGADPNIRDPQGRTALMHPHPFDTSPTQTDYINPAEHNDKDLYYYDVIIAFRFSNYISVEIIETLLNNGAKLLADSNGITPLMDAFTNPQQEEAFAIAQLYLQHGANIEAKDNWGRTPLMYAVANSNTEGVKLLLENGTDVSVKDNEGRTALFYAKSSEVIELLHNYGINLDTQDKNGMTSLMYVIQKGSKNAYCALIKAGANLALRDNEGLTASLHAVKTWHTWRDEESLVANINTQDSEGNTALMLIIKLAIEKGYLSNKTIELLLKDGVSLDIQNLQGETALIVLSKSAKERLIKANKENNLNSRQIINDYLDNFIKLVKAGANPSIRDNKGNTAFDYFRELVNLPDIDPIIAELIRSKVVFLGLYLEQEVGSLINNNLGYTPLMYAVANYSNEAEVTNTNYSNEAEVTKRLLEEIEDINVKDTKGRTALFYAPSSKAIKLLTSHGANINIQDNKGFTPLHSLIWHCFNPASQWFVSHEFRKDYKLEQCSEAIKLLLDLGADPNLQDVNGMTPLMSLALGTSNYEILIYSGFITTIEIIDELVNAGANIDLRNDKGETALILLGKSFIKGYVVDEDRSSIYYLDTLEKFLDLGANVNIKDNKGNIALDYFTEVDEFYDTETYTRLLWLSTPKQRSFP